jgi:hypothetical protein
LRLGVRLPPIANRKSQIENSEGIMHDLILKIRQFADERDWEQFHSPEVDKRLICGL